MGPRQMTASFWGMKKPVEMTLIPKRSTGATPSSAVMAGFSVMPRSVGMLGPYTSASRRPTFTPVWESATARLALTVDLPTPPLPLATATMFFTPGRNLRGGTATVISIRGDRGVGVVFGDVHHAA